MYFTRKPCVRVCGVYGCIKFCRRHRIAMVLYTYVHRKRPLRAIFQPRQSVCVCVWGTAHRNVSLGNEFINQSIVKVAAAAALPAAKYRGGKVCIHLWQNFKLLVLGFTCWTRWFGEPRVRRGKEKTEWVSGKWIEAINSCQSLWSFIQI